MDPPPPPTVHDATDGDDANQGSDNVVTISSRRDSISQKSEDSQTAADFIRDQMQLEADAREALPYSIKNCTRPLGYLRQNIYACLTCNPAPADPNDPFNPAGICYSCSVQCHGEHELVEIFQKRNFTCDCGTTRFKPDQPCTLRINPDTETQGNVHSELPAPGNKYNQNFRNRFCVCSIDYSPHEQKGTMFQCLGLGTHFSGGCGEDWYHPGCLVGQGPKWYEKMPKKIPATIGNGNGALAPIAEEATQENGETEAANGLHSLEEDEEDVPLPDGFPEEDDFDHFLCYKCVEANPWIKRYAGTPGFLPAVFLQKGTVAEEQTASTKKRKLDGDSDIPDEQVAKRIKNGPEDQTSSSGAPVLSETQIKDEDEIKEVSSQLPECKLVSLPPAPDGVFSLFVKSDFRDKFCRCAACFPKLRPHPQLLEQEEEYEPPLSDSASDHGSTHGSGSLYERGESALKNVDRVRAIEGVMAYNNLKEKLTPFFKQFAESGKAIGAEDIKEYFAKLRGDDEAIKEAGEAAKEDHRKEQPGY
ncbi:hypothetical protein F5Y18DRAFT_13025 [Xylariaceae sp. FL1019]|nr:hypothetical protein F5Y18DRAFT_13025 [Xylariaceae sp. FL1019]